MLTIIITVEHIKWLIYHAGEANEKFWIPSSNSFIYSVQTPKNVASNLLFAIIASMSFWLNKPAYLQAGTCNSCKWIISVVIGHLSCFVYTWEFRSSYEKFNLNLLSEIICVHTRQLLKFWLFLRSPYLHCKCTCASSYNWSKVYQSPCFELHVQYGCNYKKLW